MIENLLLKSNFLGKDGFRWWIGQIPPATCWNLQFNRKPDAWGNRVKFVLWDIILKIQSNLKMKIYLGQLFLYQQHGSGKAGKRKPIRIQPR